MNFEREHVVVEDVNDSDDSDSDVEMDEGDEAESCVKELSSSQEHESKEVAKAQSKATSMTEVIKDLEDQFKAACNAAGEMSSILEASRAQYTSSSNDLSAMKMLNPVALFRSGSSRSSSSRFVVSASTSREEGYESSSDFSEESSICSGSHQSTLDRLYAWEKKLYQEVRAGERVRIAYEKKFEAVSKRIETLRDEELEPQLLELVHGQDFTSRNTFKTFWDTKVHDNVAIRATQARSFAANLETELRNWRACFDSWIVSQRSYLHALKGWLLRCVRSDPETSRLPFSPRRSLGAPPIFNICIQWSKFLDAVQEAPVLDGMDFFAAGVGSLYEKQLREDSRRQSGGSKRFGGESIGNMEVVEAGHFEDEVVTAEKMAEVAIRVLCAGMSVAVSALTEFAVSSADGYSDLIKQWENSKQSLHGTEK
ncbi:hypothetical protein DH2020_014802 [Rehmannia glutinosa]|uniref:DUF632 domain-containing protein n=1 Tax=Rehmannia glutinosa TaxID=99300 RepID=A0ABR0WXL3_REHGL